MAFLYILAGSNHFVNPRMYLKIIPNAISMPKLINYANGIAEIILGIALSIPAISGHCAQGIMALLILPANCYMLTNKIVSFDLLKWLLILRLPLQIV